MTTVRRSSRKGDGMNNDPKCDYAEVNGLEMYYEIHGSGEPLILLYGGVGATEMFGGVLPLLVEGRRTVALELQAHGLAARIVKLAEATRVLAAGYLAGERRRDG
jgi:pimeloyl-ACP methyl ester carboxylesterase